MLLDIINKLKKLKIAVVGDGMVDEYFQVSANRISPEFPIIALSSQFNRPDLSLPGGATNVCSQFQHFDVDVSFFGFIDVNLFDTLQKYPINFKHAQWLSGSQHVPIKRRFYDGDFPLCRWDLEIPNYGIDNGIQDKVFDELRKRHDEYDLIIFSDYGKGLFNDFYYFRDYQFNTPTLVDPKKMPLKRWYGCNIFKPNFNEAKELSGLTDWKEQSDFFKKELNCDAVVITHGGNGVCGKDKNGYFEYLPCKKISYESVIGAGDCFMAFLAMAYGSGIEVCEAAKFAYEAGVVYVQNKHNKPVSNYDLIKSVDPIKAKFVSLDHFKNRDYKLVFTNGCFDLGLHSGHLECLQKAKSCGDKLVVAINSDESVSKLKGKDRPIVNLEERMLYVASLEFVDFVISFDDDTPYELIKEVKPDILVKGGDYKIEDIAGHDLVSEVILIPLIENKSTTGRIQKILSSKKSKFSWNKTTYGYTPNGEVS